MIVIPWTVPTPCSFDMSSQFNVRFEIVKTFPYLSLISVSILIPIVKGLHLLQLWAVSPLPPPFLYI